MKTEDLYPVALHYVKRFTKRADNNKIFRGFHGYETLDDVAMDVVEKVLKCNPTYLTKAYVRIVTKCVCINKLNKKTITQYEHFDKVSVTNSEAYGTDLTVFFDAEDIVKPIEHILAGDVYDILKELEEFILPCLGKTERETYDAMMSEGFYPELAENLGISTRTLERRVHDLKYKLTYILTEEDPM